MVAWRSWFGLGYGSRSGEMQTVSSSPEPSEINDTLDSPPASVVRGGSPSPLPRRAALVGDHTPHLHEETRDLLRSRLRASALIMFAGFSVFFVKDLVSISTYTTARHWILFGSHVAITLITGLIGIMMCRKCSISIGKLRIAELTVFGGSALFFVMFQLAVCDQCLANGMLPHLAPPWLLLMLTYAMFVPNTWQRAAVVLGAMAATPALLSIYLAYCYPQFSALVAANLGSYQDFLVEMTLLMGVGFGTATFGVYTIGSLRRAAFEAKQLGQYRLKEKLGEGGMGEVYLAEHQLMKRPCAIKVIRPEKAGDPNVLARFEREVRATAKLSHWNSIEIFDYGRQEDGTFYYVMEYLPGMNLAQLVERHGPLPPARVIHLMIQACDALSEAHDKAMVHRDIKPANIFAARRGGIYDVTKLLDFGLAKPLVRGLDSVALTQQGAITGSPLFMSPEQVSGENAVDARSDIYSLGAVMYYLLTGRPPFEGDKPLQVMIAHAHQEPSPPSQVRGDIPEDLDRVVLTCLAKSPGDRYVNAEALRQALAGCDAAGRWTREMATAWWLRFGCPQKRAFQQAAIEAAID